jgi:hypothetical protein
LKSHNISPKFVYFGVGLLTSLTSKTNLTPYTIPKEWKNCIPAPWKSADQPRYSDITSIIIHQKELINNILNLRLKFAISVKNNYYTLPLFLNKICKVRKFFIRSLIAHRESRRRMFMQTSTKRAIDILENTLHGFTSISVEDSKKVKDHAYKIDVGKLLAVKIVVLLHTKVKPPLDELRVFLKDLVESDLFPQILSVVKCLQEVPLITPRELLGFISIGKQAKIIEHKGWEDVAKLLVNMMCRNWKKFKYGLEHMLSGINERNQNSKWSQLGKGIGALLSVLGTANN